MVPVLLGLRFVVEMCLLAAYAIVGYSAFESRWAGAVAAVALVIIVAACWGVLLSPRRQINLSLPVRVTLELVLFALAAVALVASGYPALAAVLVSAELITIGALALKGYPPGSDVGLQASE